MKTEEIIIAVVVVVAIAAIVYVQKNKPVVDTRATVPPSATPPAVLA